MNKTFKYLVPGVINNIDPDSIKLRKCLIEEDENALIIGFFSGVNEIDAEDNIYIVFSFKSDRAFSKIVNNPLTISYDQIGDIFNDKVIVKLRLKKGTKSKFINGEYSKLYDREMIEELLSKGHISLDTADVLLQNPKKKEQLESIIGEIPSNAELDSVFNLSDEIYPI